MFEALNILAESDDSWIFLYAMYIWIIWIIWFIVFDDDDD